VKHKKVLEKLYDPGRPRKAWQQIKKNAGAAGVDKITVKQFERREGNPGQAPRDWLCNPSFWFVIVHCLRYSQSTVKLCN